MGNMGYKCSIIMCLVVNFVFSQGVSEVFPVQAREAVILSSNATVFVVGEELYYKFYGLVGGNLPSSISKLGYVELLSSGKEKLFSHKLKLDNGVAHGDFFIPTNVKTGHYKLIAYTKWNSKSFFQKDVFIINPYTAGNAVEKDSSNNNFVEIASITEKNSLLTANKAPQSIIKTDKNSYSLRSKVVLQIDNGTKELPHGHYSLSVRKINPIQVLNKEDLKSTTIAQTSRKALPEIRGEIISGTVKSKQDNSVVPNKIVSISFPGKNYIYKNSITDSSGKFYFNVLENYNDTNALVQLSDKNKENYRIVLDDNGFQDYGELTFEKVKLDPNIKDWILRESIYNQIESAYYKTKRDSIVAKQLPSVFYGEASVDYVLDDYKRFPSLRETFIEVVEKAAIRGENGGFKFKVFDYEEKRSNRFSELEPLVLFDGVSIQNADAIIDYDAGRIERISVVRGIYFYGPSIFNGIIDITSKKGDFTLMANGDNVVKLKLSAPEHLKLHDRPNYSDIKRELDRIPDYRRQLLWEPNIRETKQLDKLEFYTSDVEGVFEILLEGYTLSGKQFYSKSYFDVENKL
ncbi:hypothetical protein GCM10022395_13010 [Snuella lapsa]|uniref:Uncharacterized protein n=2 Tax=Snuella lapsa TaxID=870481 RepID=A0ABP6XAU7_9FLAO